MKKKIKVNDKVVVNKNIFRLEEEYQLLERLNVKEVLKPKTAEEYQTFDWAKWSRKSILYAEQGETGVVVDIFHDCNGKLWKGGRVRLFAKVKIGDKIKTFRTTSLDKVM